MYYKYAKNIFLQYALELSELYKLCTYCFHKNTCRYSIICKITFSYIKNKNIFNNYMLNSNLFKCILPNQ